jgi:hypothetical protein
LIQVIGKTVDDRTVVQGVYRFYETTGVPLDVILDQLRERGVVPDWPQFVIEAVEAGMSVPRAISLLEPALADSFGSAFCDVVVSRLKLLLDKR